MPDVSMSEFFSATLPPPDPLRDTLEEIILHKYDNTPRHLQKALGPSEVGHPCMRKVALGLMDEPACNPSFDPLPSIIGTATHSWLQNAVEEMNTKLGRERFIAEGRVNVTGNLAGSCDVFDTDTGTVVDWKVPGSTRFDMYRKKMSETFIAQAHLYGLGFENRGYQVRQVAIALLPRNGYLKGMYLWREPYSRDFAQSVVQRYEQIIGLCDDLDVDQHPDRYQWITATPYDCRFCDWFKQHPRSGIECSGKASE